MNGTHVYVQPKVKCTQRRVDFGTALKSVYHFSLLFPQVTNGNCQIVNIGAGFDTLYWRLVDEGKTVKGFVEFDFPGVTSRKCLYIQRTKQLLQAVSDEGEDRRALLFFIYTWFYHDSLSLRNCGCDKAYLCLYILILSTRDFLLLAMFSP